VDLGGSEVVAHGRDLRNWGRAELTYCKFIGKNYLRAVFRPYIDVFEGEKGVLRKP